MGRRKNVLGNIGQLQISLYTRLVRSLARHASRRITGTWNLPGNGIFQTLLFSVLSTCEKDVFLTYFANAQWVVFVGILFALVFVNLSVSL